ncbi:hypothetical protein [Leifsonia sp. Le1]|uniref:hypothetical protein n=1 Tax=Leifsonia sp. Le1 TaxID=3404918 RepID=UPI003EB924CB
MLVDRLAQIPGFRRRVAGILTWHSADPVIGWVGLNVSRPAGSPTVALNPVIGIRDDRIEDRVAELGGRKRHAYVPPTVSRSLGYLSPEATYVPHYFSIPASAEQIDYFIDAVEANAVPFFVAHCNRASVRELLDARMVPYDVFAFERLLALAVEESDVCSAEKIVSEWKPSLHGRSDPAAMGAHAYIAAVSSALGITV